MPSLPIADQYVAADAISVIGRVLLLDRVWTVGLEDEPSSDDERLALASVGLEIEGALSWIVSRESAIDRVLSLSSDQTHPAGDDVLTIKDSELQVAIARSVPGARSALRFIVDDHKVEVQALLEKVGELQHGQRPDGDLREVYLVAIRTLFAGLVLIVVPRLAPLMVMDPSIEYFLKRMFGDPPS